MSRGFKPVKSTGSNNLFAAGHRDPILRKMLGPALLNKLAGKKPVEPKDNFEAARMYHERQSKRKEGA